jgi:hypothetical protein
VIGSQRHIWLSNIYFDRAEIQYHFIVYVIA